MMKSTRWRAKTLSISKNLGLEFCTECEQRVYLILQNVEALARRQGQHSANQREVDSVLTVLRRHEFSLLLRAITCDRLGPCSIHYPLTPH
jgi:hypothetical protein